MAADSSFYGSRKSLGGTGSLKLKQEKFSFPLLQNAEIVQCLSELHVQLEEADLAKARPAQLRHIYELLLCDCLDMSKEELYQPKFVGLDALKHSELHEDSVPVLHFVRGMDKLLKACGINAGFTLKDLVKPDPRRVRRNLSAIINFHKFREERLLTFTKFTERGEQLAASKAALEEERAALEAEIAALAAAREAEQPAIDALTAECEEREASITELNHAQAKIRAGTNGVKEAIAAVKDETAGVQFAVLSTQEAVEAARGSLVASPDRVKGEVAAQEAALAADKAALTAAEDAKRSVRARLAVASSAASEVAQLSAALQDFDGELARATECAEQVADAQRLVDLQAADAAEISAEKRHLEGQVTRLQEKLGDFRGSQGMKLAAVTRALEGMQAEYSELIEEGDATDAKRKAGQAEQAALTATLDAAKETHEGEMRVLLDNMRELQREVKGYHARLFANLNTADGVPGKALRATA